MATLIKQSENAQLRRKIAEDRLQTEKAKAYKQFLNKNLVSSRKRKTGSTTPGSPERDMTNSDRKKLMANARQLVEENPLGIGILRTNLDFVVGSGYALSMRSSDNDFNKLVEKLWKAESDEIDARGLRSFGGLQRAIQARKIVDGDVFVLISDKVQLLEADRCYKDITMTDDCGIDYDDDGKPKTYYFGKRAPGSSSQSTIKPSSYNADSIFPFFNFPDERVERKRGVSSFLQLLNLIKDIDENLEAMDIKAKNEAFMGLKFSITPNEDGSIFAGMNTQADDGGTVRGHVKMVNGMNVNLEPNEDVAVIEGKSPHESYVPFIRFRMRMAGIPLGIPLEFLLADASETNYSGLMMLSQMLRRSIKFQQAELCRISSKIFKWWLAGKIGSIKSVPEDYMDHAWGKPAIGFIDPLKEAKAFNEMLQSKTMSRQDVLSQIGDGQDFQELADQIAKEQNYMDELGITYSLGDPGAPLANYEGEGSSFGQTNKGDSE